jgi:hypothetical protein
MHLWVNFFLERPLFEEGQLSALQTLLHRHLPTWCTRLVAARDEDSDGATVDSQRSLHQAVQEAAPQGKYGLGEAVLTGSYEGLALFLDSSRKAFPPESNGFSVEIVDITAVEGKQASTWAWEFFRDVPNSLAVRYGNARSAEEFERKNLDTTGGGARAIGVNLQESLPGLYWLNFLGRPYQTLIGKERLLSTPAYRVETIDGGTLIALDSAPAAWETPAYGNREERSLDHLGRKYFFQRRKPEAVTVGADFLPPR